MNPGGCRNHEKNGKKATGAESEIWSTVGARIFHGCSSDQLEAPPGMYSGTSLSRGHSHDLGAKSWKYVLPSINLILILWAM
jgi:hypothetical protein